MYNAKKIHHLIFRNHIYKALIKNAYFYKVISFHDLILYKCDYDKLNDESFLRCTLNNAAKLANAKVLNLISNKFEPQGVTAIALLAESHISIHTWPEAHYSAVDIFTCGQNMKPEISCKYLIQALKAKEHLLRVIDRNPPSDVYSQIKK